MAIYAERRAALNHHLRDKGRRVAEQRRCPECKRGMAIRIIKVDLTFSVRKCRYCTYERAMDLYDLLA